MPNIINYNLNGIADGLNLPIRELPEVQPQKRKRQASRSWASSRIMGADTETVEGAVWLFSTETGVWEIRTLEDIIKIMFMRKHCVKWKKSKATKNGVKRGLSTHHWFFWNLKFDAQAIMKLLSERAIEELLLGEKVTVNAITGDLIPQLESSMVEIKYLEGKNLTIKPINWKIGQYTLGEINWWDISQFYYKTRLNTMAKNILGEEKIEKCFDGSILDASRFDDPEYRDYYREDIEEYAIQDAILCGKLARKCRDDYVSQNIRFIKPYSLANVAQRCLLDTSDIPTINDFLDDEHELNRLRKALSAYHGGWFETTGAGFVPKASGVDLASAYPYVMYHLKDMTKGYWIEGDVQSEWWEWIDKRQPYDMGFAEATILFEPNDWYPLVTKSPQGTLVAPRFVRGWFTADELAEARKWPHVNIVIGEWFYHYDEKPTYPFRDFISHFYELKMNAANDPIAYKVAKVMLNSIYGKTIQAVDDRAGKLWNPFYAATITGGTRARLAEFNRLNGFKAFSYATDGIMLQTKDLKVIPKRPLAAPHNLGEWELEGDGDVLIIMSGVYSMRMGNKVKTTFRGTASYFVRDYRDGGLFKFCEDHANSDYLQKTIRRPYSAKQARVKGDYTLINRFEPFTCSITPMGDSTKRMWGEATPKIFDDLLTAWWKSSSHENIDIVEHSPLYNDESLA